MTFTLVRVALIWNFNLVGESQESDWFLLSEYLCFNVILWHCPSIWSMREPSLEMVEMCRLCLTAQSYVKEALVEHGFCQHRQLQSSHKVFCGSSSIRHTSRKAKAFLCMLADVGRPAGAGKPSTESGMGRRWGRGCVRNTVCLWHLLVLWLEEYWEDKIVIGT